MYDPNPFIPVTFNIDFGGAPVSIYTIHFTKKHSDVIQGNGRSYPIEVTGSYAIHDVRADGVAAIIAEVLKKGYRLTDVALYE